MCGIFALLNDKGDQDVSRMLALEHAKRLRHRGPDWARIEVQNTPKGTNFLVHKRLAIVNPINGDQPFYNKSKTLCLIANAEIYNYKELKEKYLNDIEFDEKSDCLVILYLFEKFRADCVNLLDGDFSFVISDSVTGDYFAARDPMGVVSLYYGYDNDGVFWFSSEMKAIHDICPIFKEFPPGHYYCSKSKTFIKYFNPSWIKENWISNSLSTENMATIRNSLITSVHKRLMTDVPFGVLLSGGLDSSIIAAIANRYVQKHPDLSYLMNFLISLSNFIGKSKLHSFSVGFNNSPDLTAAKKVALFLGTEHHSYEFSIQEGVDSLSDVIYHLETYDVTTIRASVPMYLLSRKIKSFGIKMLLTGEGSDESFGGYLYFHKAPNEKEFYQETLRKLSMLHFYDCLRVNKISSAWGLEARVPFLDKEFLEIVMNTNCKDKLIRAKSKDKEGRPFIEKYILRKSFDCVDDPWIPEEILWRQKEQFSDGVGYSWIDFLKIHTEKNISDSLFMNAKHRYPFNTPETKEAYYYRTIFEKHFSSKEAAESVHVEASVACSSSVALEWNKEWKNNPDPSGRIISEVHFNGIT